MKTMAYLQFSPSNLKQLVQTHQKYAGALGAIVLAIFVRQAREHVT